MENFKVGDFVTDGYDLMKVLEVKEQSLVVDIFRDRVDSHPDYLVQEIICLSVLKHWTPKQGEWCWFWNKTDIEYRIIPHLGQYENLSYSLDFYDCCEPFIGELPSTYKVI